MPTSAVRGLFGPRDRPGAGFFAPLDGAAPGAWVAEQKPVRFTAKLEPADVGTFVVIPPEVATALGATGRTSVSGTIDGQPFTNQVMPYTFEGSGRRVVMVVNKAVRTSLRKEAGDSVDFVLARDDR